jgi:hypothetical protein
VAGGAVNGLGRFLRAEWDRVAGYGCIAAGLVLLVAGIAGVRRSADVIDEISYLVTGGIGSIFLLGVGSTLLLSADLHDDFRKLHRVEQKLDRVERILLAEHPELLDVTDTPPGTGPAAPVVGNARATRPATRPAAAPAVENAEATRPETRPAAAPATLAVRRGRFFAAVGIGVAAVLFAAGAFRTADQPTTDHLAGPVGLALAGALLVAFVAAVMVAQLRASVEWRKAAVFGKWIPAAASGRGAGALTAVDAGPARRVALPGAAVFVVTGLPLYHRAGCQLLAGRAVTECQTAALPPGVSACRLCEPA